MFYLQLDIRQRANGWGLDGFPLEEVGENSKKGMDVISVEKINNVTKRFV